MQCMKTWPKVSKYRRRSQKLYSINCGMGGHVYKTIIRTFFHLFYTSSWCCFFLKHKIQCWQILFCTDWMHNCINIAKGLHCTHYKTLFFLICGVWSFWIDYFKLYCKQPTIHLYSKEHGSFSYHIARNLTALRIFLGHSRPFNT